MLCKEHLGGVAGMVSRNEVREQRRREMNKIFLAGENYCVSLRSIPERITTKNAQTPDWPRTNLAPLDYAG